jgi:hypothetical protein
LAAAQAMVTGQAEIVPKKSKSGGDNNDGM